MKKFWSALPLVALLATPVPAFAIRSGNALLGVTKNHAFVITTIGITPNWLKFSGDEKGSIREEVRCGIVNVHGARDVGLNDYIYYRQTITEPSYEEPSKKKENTSFKVIGYKNYIAAILLKGHVGTKDIVVTEGFKLDDPSGDLVTLKGEYDRRTDTLENLKVAPEEKFTKRTKILEIYTRTRKQVFDLAKSPKGRQLFKTTNTQEYREERERTACLFYDKVLLELKKTLGRRSNLSL